MYMYVCIYLYISEYMYICMYIYISTYLDIEFGVLGFGV